MSRPINISDTIKLIPNSYTNTGTYNFTNQTINNAYDDADSTSSNRMTLARNSNSTRKSEIYYEFDKSSLTNIPSNATITSITANVKYYVNSTTRVTAVSMQLYSNTTAKGTAVTSRPTSGTKYAITAGTWTRAELDNIRLYVSGTHNASTNNGYIYFYGADVTINYSLSYTEYEITSTLNADAVDIIDPAGSTWVTEGENYELIIYTDSVDDIIVEDNGNDVTNQLVFTHPIGGSSTDTFIPSSFDYTNSIYDTTSGTNGVYNTNYIDNGLTNHNSSTRASIYAVQGSNADTYIYYNFDCSSIPRNATITSVSCQVKAGNQGTDYYSSNYRQVQLCSGTTTKGTSQNITGSNSSPSTVTVDGGSSWTRAELDDIKIRYWLRRGTSNTTTGATTSFYGATLTVTYTVPASDYYVYTLTNVSTDHEIVIEDAYTGPRYLVTATSNYSEATITPEERNVGEGRSITFTINVTNLYEITITDNGNDIKSNLTGSNGTYTYTITNVQATHAIVINEQLSYSITTSSTYSGATVSAPSKVYIGQNATVTVTVDNFSLIKIFDDDTDITSQFTGSGTTYTYTFTNVQANHNISIIEKGKINVTCISNVEGVTLNPSGVTAVNENNSFTVAIEGELTSDMVLTDNGVDVTSQITQQSVQVTDTIERYPESYTTSGSISGTRYQGAIGHSVENPSTQTGNDYASGGNNSTAYIDYAFDFSDIPQNATIESVTVIVRGHAENINQSSERAELQLYSDNTSKGSMSEFNSTSAQNITMSPGTWTRAELQNAKLRFTIGYYGGIVLGVTWSVEYSHTDTATGYKINSVTEPHDIILSKVFIPEEEDPELVYHSLTVSSINATTNPTSGTTRIVEGTNQTITIYPTDPLLTLVTDNGVDITDSLVHHGQSIPDPTVSSVSGASYGFSLNGNTGYYVSQNAGQSSSAALCRVTFNLPVKCLVTIQYINYAEATYDYGVFGNIDTALNTAYNNNSNAFRVLSSSSDNSPSPQTLTYEIESGSHFIDIKYRKDQAENSNNDNLQWKILSIEPLEANEYYEYTISNISDDHSLVFIFGDVTYYFITSTGTGCKLYPNGSLVQLPGDNYKLTIVPDSEGQQVQITDNNSDVTNDLQRIEREITKEGNTYTIVNYIYEISNVQATHDIVVISRANSTLFLKINNTWVQSSKMYQKVNGIWKEVGDAQSLFERNINKVYYPAN